jgi:hypothetical protein
MPPTTRESDASVREQEAQPRGERSRMRHPRESGDPIARQRTRPRRRSRWVRRIRPRARGAASRRAVTDASSPRKRGSNCASAHTSTTAQPLNSTHRPKSARRSRAAMSGRAQRDRKQRPSPPRRRGPCVSLRVTQARDTATSQVRSARVSTGSVIPSSARDPGVAGGADSSPAARNDKDGAAPNDEERRLGMTRNGGSE